MNTGAAQFATTSEQEKITIVPLRSIGHNLLAEGEAIDLGCGLSVERCHNFLAAADLSLWSFRAAEHEQQEITEWDECLVHRYSAERVTGEAEEASTKLLAYVLAHLRLINPHRDSIDDNVQLQKTSSGQYNAFRCSKAAFRPNRFLCDFESLCWGIGRRHLETLKYFVPWIVEFALNWERFYPLWISMYFFEQAYLGNQNLRTAHLFRVMALEALFCSETSFGKKALTRRIPKLIGNGIDLFESYQADYFASPKLELTVDLIKDVYTLRNKVAHSDAIPQPWKTQIARHGPNEEITYAGELLEAATAMGRLAWLKILQDQLQPIFSDKQRMQDYLR